MVSDHDHGSDANTIGFFKILRDGHLRGSEFMIIPRGFERKYKITLPNPLVLRLPNNGAEWKVYWIKRDYEIWFQQDWIRFAQDCSFRDHQVLDFKYEDGSHFKVRIFDESFYDIDYSGIRCSIESDDEPVKSPVNDNYAMIPESEIQTQIPVKFKNNEDVDATQQKVSAGGVESGHGMAEASIQHQKPSSLEKAMNYNIKNPCFKIKLKPSYVNNDVLMMPRKFSKKYLNGFRGTASIGVSDNSTKHIQIKINDISKQTFMTSGWKSFCNEYNLKAGDKCFFDMTHKSTPVSFKISIFRSREKPNNQLQGTEHNSASNNTYTMLIRKYHLNSYTRTLRQEFFRKYPRCDRKRVKLQVGEKWWEVKVINYGRFGKFSAGWTTFVNECSLEPENIWELDMIDEKNLLFRVSISS
ncbi:hypothetical protein RIF29_14722 [Crotalaria pallida]|uniref:TF-B3 domain-containing protein n=1 Tax=Crotalaria pallida TaxID=3830 RepID=A0AAN9FDW7_CROPI